MCDAARSGAAWLRSGSTMQYSMFWSLLQGSAGPDCGSAVDSGQWSMASGRWPVVGGRWSMASCRWSVVGGQELLRTSPAGRRRDWLATCTHGGGVHGAAGDWRESRRRGGIVSPVADRPAGEAQASWHTQGGSCGGSPPAQGRAGTAVIRDSDCGSSARRLGSSTGCGGDELESGTHGGITTAGFDVAAGQARSRWHWLPVVNASAGETQARWHCLPDADTSAGEAQASWHTQGGRCGGSPPAQGRAGTARPPKRQRRGIAQGLAKAPGV